MSSFIGWWVRVCSVRRTTNQSIHQLINHRVELIDEINQSVNTEVDWSINWFPDEWDRRRKRTLILIASSSIQLRRVKPGFEEKWKSNSNTTGIWRSKLKAIRMRLGGWISRIRTAFHRPCLLNWLELKKKTIQFHLMAGEDLPGILKTQ